MWTHISDVSQWLDSHWRLIPRWVKISFVMFSFLVAVSAYFGLGPWSGISMHAEATTDEGVKLHNTDRLETMVRAIVKEGVEENRRDMEIFQEENRRAMESLQDDIREETGEGAEAVREDRKFLELMAAFQEIRRSMEVFQEENRKAMEVFQEEMQEKTEKIMKAIEEERR